MSKREWNMLFRIIRDFMQDSRSNKGMVACVLLLSVIKGVRPFIAILLMGILLDAVYAGEELSVLLQYAAWGIGISFGLAMISAWLQERFNRKNEYMLEIQNQKMNRKSLQMDYENLENTHLQELRRRVERSTGSFGLYGYVFDNIFWMVPALVQTIVAFFIVVPLFFRADSEKYGLIGSPAVTVLLFAVIGALVWWSYKIGVKFGRQNKKYVEMHERQDNIKYFYMNNVLAGYETQKDARIYHQQGVIKRELDAMIGRIRELEMKAGKESRKREYFVQLAGAASGLLVYLFAGLRAYVGMISIGSVVSYAGSILKLMDGFRQVMETLADCKGTAMYAADYEEYMDTPQKRYEGTIPVEKRRDNRFSVEFEHVSFRYPGSDIYVLKDLNVSFTIGERMAIVGKNGSGKTTFIKLLCRLYDVTEGCIKVNGIDIRKYNYQEYMALFSVVFQDFKIFSFELGENIAASGTVDRKKAVDALYRAGLQEVYDALPEGLDTFVGREFSETGVSFSGGEKQKMAIARAIYKGAPFVIMDEPTAALDPISECEVYEGFDKMVGEWTAIYISHRLASCRFCQDILVFDRGQVVERGTHEELVAREGLYTSLWNAQAKYYE